MSGLQVKISLVDAAWLKEHLDHPNLVLLDATWFLPKLERSGKDEFLKEHIPGAQFFDYDSEICDRNSEFPRMMPSAQEFTSAVKALGVNRDSLVIIYDNNDMFSSPRAWWMFRAMGVTQVAILDGGLIEWKARGFEVSSEVTEAKAPGDFVAQPKPEAFIDSKKVLDRLESEKDVVIDARAAERFDEAHMPGAKNLHYAELLTDGKMKSVAELQEKFKVLMPDGVKPTFSCGSGVTACILALGAHICGYQDISVYDASWSEWGKSEDLPKEPIPE